MSDTPISQVISEKQGPILSYEFFPPKTDAGFENLRGAVKKLGETQPDFATVTYGAGGSTRALTLNVCSMLREVGMGPVMPHLTCVGSTRAELEEIAGDFYAQGYRNIMTLRGDPPKGEDAFVPPADGLSNARDLVALLKELQHDFCCGVAGYPEVHPEAISEEAEMAYLKEKIDAGAAFITTQLFFDNDHYYRFVDRCVNAGIDVPVLPGLLPASSMTQLTRFTGMCGCTIPEGLQARLEAAGEEPAAGVEAGIAWCVDQINDLLKNGAPGIHLYILNQARDSLHDKLVDVFPS